MNNFDFWKYLSLEISLFLVKISPTKPKNNGLVTNTRG